MATIKDVAEKARLEIVTMDGNNDPQRTRSLVERLLSLRTPGIAGPADGMFSQRRKQLFAGCGDINFPQFTQPALTTVSVPRAEIGRLAFQSLWSLMHESPGAITKSKPT